MNLTEFDILYFQTGIKINENEVKFLNEKQGSKE